MDLIVLTFVAGFAVATLVFWPLLQRAQRRSPLPVTSGRHRKTTQNTPAVVAEQKTEEPEPKKDTERTEPVISIAYAEPEPVDMPELPTDLFSKRYEARFNRARKRLDRLRTQINEQ